MAVVFSDWHNENFGVGRPGNNYILKKKHDWIISLIIDSLSLISNTDFSTGLCTNEEMPITQYRHCLHSAVPDRGWPQVLLNPSHMTRLHTSGAWFSDWYESYRFGTVCPVTQHLLMNMFAPLLVSVRYTWPCCFMSTEAGGGGGGGGGGGRESEGSTADAARKRPERPWTTARTMEVLRRCMSPHHCAATSALRNCCFNCRAWAESQGQCPLHCCWGTTRSERNPTFAAQLRFPSLDLARNPGATLKIMINLNRPRNCPRPEGGLKSLVCVCWLADRQFQSNFGNTLTLLGRNWLWWWWSLL